MTITGGTSNGGSLNYQCFGKLIDTNEGFDISRIIIQNFTSTDLGNLKAGLLTINMNMNMFSQNCNMNATGNIYSVDYLF